MGNLERLGEMALSCQTESELLDFLKLSLESFGFENYALSTHTDSGPAMIGADLPSGWGEYYLSNGYHLIDPVFAMMGKTWAPHVWDDLIDDDTDQKTREFMRESDDCGIKHGHTLSIPHLGQKMNCAISSRHDLGEDAAQKMLGMSFAILSMFATKRAMIQSESVALKVTAKEREVAKWIAAGLTTPEIANRMTISENTVKEYVRRICTKNNLNNRVDIAIRAIISGLTDL